MSTLKSTKPELLLNSAATAQRVAEVARTRSEQALRLVCANLPWLSGLAYAVTLHVDQRVRVAAVTATGRVLVNPEVFAKLPMREAVYVMAHELLHLALDTFSRESQFDDHDAVNRAHDYIINDMLRNELHMPPPLNGLDLLGASEKSLEQVLAWMNENKSKQPECCWMWTDSWDSTGSPISGGVLTRALRDAGILAEPETLSNLPDVARTWHLDNLDIIPRELERELFPDDQRAVQRQVNDVRRAAVKALSLKNVCVAVERLLQKGSTPGNQENLIEALRGCYQTPWQSALQRWMEAVAPGQRTYARPSRRGADRSDCVLPGRFREGWTLHLVLDTSGSMAGELSRELGAIAGFCESAGVNDVHILQCDVEVTVDEWVPMEQLSSYRIAGYGGSDMSPAMRRLAEDSEVSAMIVITDGFISYPSEVPPCQVLWVLTTQASFDPPYGEILRLTDN